MKADYGYDLFVRAVDKGMDVEHAARLGAEVQRRIDQGRSHDCDAFRVLIGLASDNRLSSHRSKRSAIVADVPTKEEMRSANGGTTE